MASFPQYGERCAVGKTGFASLLLLLFLPSAYCQAPPKPPPASRIDTVYILPSSHWDFGFIRTPEDEQAAIKPHLDAVLAACKQDPEFRWTIESIWQLQAWVQRTQDPAALDEMAARIHSGQIEVSAAWGSMHTEFMGTEELNRLVDDERTLEQRFGIRGDMAMLNDVPGFSPRLPQVLARSGVQYLVNGSNTFIAGGTSLSPGHVPFYWAGPDGSRVLTWTTKGKEGGYTEGMADYFLDPDAKDPYLHTAFYPKEWANLSKEEITARGVARLVAHYADAGYTGHTIAVLYMHDGIGPEYEQSLLKNVRAWNRSGRLPRLKVATPHEYFATLSTADRAALPSYSGDWSGLWSEVKTNSPHMSADARWLQIHLPQAEELATIASLESPQYHYPASELNEAQTGLFRYDEHNGAGNGGWPKVLTEAEVNRSNAEYVHYVRGAYDIVEHTIETTLDDVLGPTQSDASDDRTFVVFNPFSWTRSGLVTLPSPATDTPARQTATITDSANGSSIATQQLPNGGIEFLATDVPSMGYRTYRIRFHTGSSPAADPNTGTHAENDAYAVDIDPHTGAVIRIFDKAHHQELTTGRDFGFASHLNTEKPAAPGDVNSPASVTISHADGPVEDRIIIQRANSWWPQTILSLPHGQAELNLDEVLDREKMPLVTAKENGDSYSFHFPFHFDTDPQRWIDDGIGFHRFPQDYLPGARTDAAVPRFTTAFSGIAGKQPFTVLFAQQQSFFTRFSPSSSDLEITAVKKSDQAETKDHGIVTFASYEPGYPQRYTFHFSIASTQASFDPVLAYRFGREAANPLQTLLLPPHTRAAQSLRSFLSVSSPHVVLDALRPSPANKPQTYLVRLQEVAGTDAVVALQLPWRILAAAETDETGNSILQDRIDPARIHIAPHQTVTLRLQLAPASAVASQTRPIP